MNWRPEGASGADEICRQPSGESLLAGEGGLVVLCGPSTDGVRPTHTVMDSLLTHSPLTSVLVSSTSLFHMDGHIKLSSQASPRHCDTAGPFIFLLISFFFLIFYLFIHERYRERGRDTGRGRIRLPEGSPMWDSIPGLWDHDLSQGQTLNCSATQASLPFLKFKFNLPIYSITLITEEASRIGE